MQVDKIATSENEWIAIRCDYHNASEIIIYDVYGAYTMSDVNPIIELKLTRYDTMKVVDISLYNNISRTFAFYKKQSKVMDNLLETFVNSNIYFPIRIYILCKIDDFLKENKNDN